MQKILNFKTSSNREGRAHAYAKLRRCKPSRPLLEGRNRLHIAVQMELNPPKKGVRFLSLLEVVSPENFKDGLHHNQAGDAEIAEAILSGLTK